MKATELIEKELGNFGKDYKRIFIFLTGNEVKVKVKDNFGHKKGMVIRKKGPV